MDIFSNPTAYAAPVIDENDDDILADLGRDSYAQTAAGEENTTTYAENGFFYEAPEVIEQTQKIQKESGAYGLYYDVDNGNYYEPAAGNSYSYGGAFGDDGSLSDQVKDFRTKIQKPLSSAIQDFAKSYYWNERFQALLERPTFTPKEIALRQADIDHFVQEFVLVAKPVCEQIVKEISVPVEKKQVKPIAAGGIAGGEKYLHKDLFLKFARDHIQIQLYGGDEWAQKAAFHELKSLTALISCGVPNLHFPMMCLVKCYGHCLVVVSKLPLSGNTLIYGSANAAVDIKTDNYDMETMLKQVTQTLNLKPHQVLETSTKTLKTLYGPVDIEGHQGLDGRYYVVDTARLFPPATPIAKVKGCHLYKLLRPELVKTNPVPLSSDAFSSFGRPNQKEHNEEAREATRRVLADIIPNKLARNKGFLKQSVKDELHSHGVNVRYLGSVYVHSKDRAHPNYDRDVHLILLIELIARAFKGVLFSEWRKIESDIPSRSKVSAVKYLNLLLGQGQNAESFWVSSLKEAMVKRFVFYPETESTDDFEKHIQYAQSVIEPNMHSMICQSPGCREKLFERAVALTGIEFVKTVPEEIRKKHDNFFKVPQPFKQGDVTNIQLLAKYIEVKPFMDVLRSNFEEAEKFYLDELKSRREILGDDHMQLALTHINLGDLYSDKNKKEQAEEQYNLALRIMKTVDADQNDVADLREKRADFYLKFDMLDKAEAELDTVINLKIKHLKEKGFTHENLSVAALKDKQARVYTKQQRFQEAKTVLEDVIHIKQAKFDHFHWQVAKSLNNLAQVMFAQKDYSKAEPICQNVLDILIRQRGPEHSEVGIALDNLAKIYAATGRRDRAQKLLEQAKDIKVKAFGDTHTYVGITLDHLASNLLATVANNQPNKEHVLEECKTYYEKALSIFKATYGDVHAALGITNNNLGLLHLKLHKYEEALSYFEKAHHIFIETVGAASPQTMATQNNIQLIKQSSPDVLETLNFEQAYHSGEMYADAGEKPVDESTQLDEATASLIRELGFDPSQFTKTQAAQILEMLNSIQTETPTPQPTPTDSYGGVGDSDGEGEYSESGSSEDSSSDWEGYVDEDKPAVEPVEPTVTPTEYSEVKPEPVLYDSLSNVKPYLYDGARSVGSTSAGATNMKDMMELERNVPPPSKGKLLKKRSSRFFESFKSGVRSAFSFWKSKDKKEAKQKSETPYPRPAQDTGGISDEAEEDESENTADLQQTVILNEESSTGANTNNAGQYEGYSYADSSPRTVDKKNDGYAAYSTPYDQHEDGDIILRTKLAAPESTNNNNNQQVDPYSGVYDEYDANDNGMPVNNNISADVNLSRDLPHTVEIEREETEPQRRSSSIINAYSDASEYEDIPESFDSMPSATPVVPAITPAKPVDVFPVSDQSVSVNTSQTAAFNAFTPMLRSYDMSDSFTSSNMAASSRLFGQPRKSRFSIVDNQNNNAASPRADMTAPPPPPPSSAPASYPAILPTSTTAATPPFSPPGLGAQMQIGSVAPPPRYDAPPSPRNASPRGPVTPPSAKKGASGTIPTPTSVRDRTVSTDKPSLPPGGSQSALGEVRPQSTSISPRTSTSLTSSAPGGSPRRAPIVGRLAREQPAVRIEEQKQTRAEEEKQRQAEVRAEGEARKRKTEVARKKQRSESEKELKTEAPLSKPAPAAPVSPQAVPQKTADRTGGKEAELSKGGRGPPKPITKAEAGTFMKKPFKESPKEKKDKDRKEKEKKEKRADEDKKEEPATEVVIPSISKKKKKIVDADKKQKRDVEPATEAPTSKKFNKSSVASRKVAPASYSAPMEDGGNLSKISSFYSEKSTQAQTSMPVQSKYTKKKTSGTANQFSEPLPQQQQTPAALLNNLSEQQKEDLRKRLQQLAGSSRQVPVQQVPQQQQAPQLQPQQAPALQQMQFNWTNI